MKKILACFLCIVLSLGLISTVSGVSSTSNYFLSKTLVRDISFLNNTTHLGDYLDISISNEKTSVHVTMTYHEIRYTGTLNGSFEDIDMSNIDGYVAFYSGTLFPIDDAVSGEALGVDVSTTFSESKLFAVVSVGFLSEDGMPDIAFYGEQDDELSAISNQYSAMSMSEVDNLSLDDDSILVEDDSFDSMALDMTIDYRGRSSCVVSGYELFNISSFHQRNLINGQDAPIYAKLNTSTSSFIQYLRNVEGYNNETVGIALDAYPLIAYLSIGGYHADYSLSNNGCVPVTGQKTVTIVIPFYSEFLGGPQCPEVTLVLSEVILTKSRYVNGCNVGNNVASWEIRDSDWDSESLDGDYTTETGISVSAEMNYNGNITQSVTRTINITGKVRYIVYMQSNTATVPVAITTDEISRATLMIVYPASYGS